MTSPDFVLLYVNDVAASAAFYCRVLERKPVEASPGFAMFVLDGGLKLGLWLRPHVEPAAAGGPGSGELAFSAAGRDAVEARHAAWKDAGIPILQAPTALDFGYTFTAADPDGHRLRVFAPPA